ncbi:MAG: response regulator [Desulfobacterales bacterium]|nr:response regulator [Desulfobacterales bacterium]
MFKENQNITILIIEDSITQAWHLKTILEEEGYKVYNSNNGMEALDFLSETKASLVISDIIMPEMDGYEVCSKIKTNEKLRDIPVILLTSLSDPEDIIKGLQCGADNFIIKPYEKFYLLSRIQYLLLNKKLMREEIQGMQVGIELLFGKQKHIISSNRLQILNLLISTYEAAIQKSRELEQKKNELNKAQETIKVLQGLLPICSNCKKIKSDTGSWERVETYISKHSEAEFTHSICPDCSKKLYGFDYTGKI